jgi:hypothetical protein
VKRKLFIGLLIVAGIILFYFIVQPKPNPEPYSSVNKIDSLKTIDDVERFVASLDSAYYPHFYKTDNIDKSTYENKFFKIDLDNNGLTDILINVTFLFAVTANEDRTYGIHLIGSGGRDLLSNILFLNKTPLIVIKYLDGIIVSPRIDTLIFKFNDFIEFNKSPDNLKIEEIRFSATACFGPCPVFDLTIKADRSVIYEAKQNNYIFKAKKVARETKGRYNAIIDTATFNNLIQTINYINLSSLKNDYHVLWSDAESVEIEIKFNDGNIKKIKDYGKRGTFGLVNLYNQLFALRNTQRWKK